MCKWMPSELVGQALPRPVGRGPQNTRAGQAALVLCPTLAHGEILVVGLVAGAQGLGEQVGCKAPTSCGLTEEGVRGALEEILVAP